MPLLRLSDWPRLLRGTPRSLAFSVSPREMICLVARTVGALLFATLAQTAVQAQDAPQGLAPLRVESDHNGVNLVTGRVRFEVPALSVPAAPNLRFDLVQNAAPVANGTGHGQLGQPQTLDLTFHTGGETSDSFHCLNGDCHSVTGSGATFTADANGYTYRQAGSGILYRYDVLHVNQIQPEPAGRKLVYYASSVTYPNGEVISYTYNQYFHTDGRRFQRPIRLSSSLGFFITVSYQTDEFFSNDYFRVKEAAIFSDAAPTVPLRTLRYGLDGTITDFGDRTDVQGRVYTCGECINQLGVDIERWTGSMQLPGESAPVSQAVGHPTNARVVSSVTTDGVQWNYAYDNLLPVPISAQRYLYDRLTVTGPNGYRHVYQMENRDNANVIHSVTENVTDTTVRTTSFDYDGSNRPNRAIYPELNRVDLVYDDFGNITSRTTTPKPGSGLGPATETASYPTDVPGACAGILCYRPSWTEDALHRRTSYIYNAAGQLTEQTDPADNAGVTRMTYIEYTATGPSRRRVLRICGLATPGGGGIPTCGTANEIRTELDYWGNTSLPLAERRIDAAAGVTLETRYTYDAAGRLLSQDGPLPGADDASYFRYDRYGRKTWEIGARGANGLRTTTRYTYRDSDDRVVATEIGTLADPTSPTLTVLSRTDLAFDARRNPTRETVSAASTTFTMVQRLFDERGRVTCEARRMVQFDFGSLPDDQACTGGDHGGRITRYVYDAASQLLQERRGVGTPSEQAYATYDYSPNGQRRTVIDANGNRAEMRFDGFDRLSCWIFPSTTRPSQFDGSTPQSALGTSGGLGGNCATGDFEAYAYDGVGNRTRLVKRDGSIITYDFDNLNRVIRKIVPERAGVAATHTRDVHYGYNLLGVQTFARFDSPTGEGVTNDYDGFGRLRSSSLNMDGTSRQLSYEYRADGTLLSLTHPGPRQFRFTHDATGRLTHVYDGATSPQLRVEFAYNAQGTVASQTGRVGAGGQSIGSTTAFGYDPVGRMVSQSHAFVGGTGNVSTELRYNAANQIIRRARTNSSNGWTGHDGVSRNYATNGLNQYISAGPDSFLFDPNGNLVSDVAIVGSTTISTTFGYDVENRLVTVRGSRTADLRYDPLGRLYEVVGSAGTTRFLYDGDALVAEYDAGGALTSRYVHGTSSGDDPLLWIDGGGVTHWLHADHQGSIVSITNGSGGIQTANGYDVWGIPNATNQGRFQFTGQAWLAEVGMYHYKARVYSPTLGRFLQTDPIGYEGGINLYAYVGNDPINRIDPDGLYDCRGTDPECARIKRYAAQVHQAARNARQTTGSRVHSNRAVFLGAVARTLGTEGDGNGIVVSNSQLDGTELGSTTMSGNNINIRLDLADIARAEARGQVTGAGALGHEVTHGIDDRRFGPVITSLPDLMRREMRAYSVQSFIDQYLNRSSQLWRPGMSAAERLQSVRTGAHRSCAAFAEEVQSNNPNAFRGQSCLR